MIYIYRNVDRKQFFGGWAKPCTVIRTSNFREIENEKLHGPCYSSRRCSPFPDELRNYLCSILSIDLNNYIQRGWLIALDGLDETIIEAIKFLELDFIEEDMDGLTFS